MHPRQFIGSLVLGASLLLGGLPANAAEKPAAATRVAVAEDKTVEAQCAQSVQINNGPIREKVCAPGSVIFVRQTTYAEVEQAGIQDYVVLTGDAEVDRAKEDKLAAKVHKDKSAAYAPLACGWGNVTLRGSYLMVPSDPNSTRVSYEVNYDKNNCQFVNVRDRSTINWGSATWEKTCVTDLDMNCSWRGFGIPAGGWTGWQAAMNTWNNNKYVHISVAPCAFCGRPYGWQWFQ